MLNTALIEKSASQPNIDRDVPLATAGGFLLPCARISAIRYGAINMGRKAKNTTQISCRVPSLALQTLARNALQLGYTGQGGKVLWGEYFAAIAAEIVRGDIDLPHRVDRDKR